MTHYCHGLWLNNLLLFLTVSFTYLLTRLLTYHCVDIPSVSLDEDLVLFHTIVTAGSGLQLKCDVRDIERVVWARNGKMLDVDSSSKFTVTIIIIL